MNRARHVRIVHAVPGRTRLRLEPCRGITEEEGVAIADGLLVLSGMSEVAVNVRTASMLCQHAPNVAPVEIAAALQALVGAQSTLGPGDPLPPVAPARSTSAVARSLAGAFRDLNTRVLAATEGRLDLGTVATLGFLGAGAVEVAVKQQLPAPPWFNLAWWGIRTFVTFENEAIREAGQRMSPHTDLSDRST